LSSPVGGRSEASYPSLRCPPRLEGGLEGSEGESARPKIGMRD
jgi:hypothetical protein